MSHTITDAQRSELIAWAKALLAGSKPGGKTARKLQRQITHVTNRSGNDAYHVNKLIACCKRVHEYRATLAS